jgi:hypothetical protein
LVKPFFSKDVVMSEADLNKLLINTVKKLNSPGYQDHEFPPNWTSLGKDSRNQSV